jgi:hypothetical protein
MDVGRKNRGAEMKACPSCSESKPVDSFHNNRATIDGKEVYCKACKNAQGRDYYQRNRDKKLAYCRQHNRDNREHKTAYMRIRRAGGSRPEGRETECTGGSDYDGLRARKNAAIRKSKKKHSHKVLANNAKRRASKLQRTPAWADLTGIDDIYLRARMLTTLAGIQFHVDHAIPLQAEGASGLHVVENLQIVTARENLSKRNKFEVAA